MVEKLMIVHALRGVHLFTKSKRQLVKPNLWKKQLTITTTPIKNHKDSFIVTKSLDKLNTRTKIIMQNKNNNQYWKEH